jgi:predicted peptidase
VQEIINYAVKKYRIDPSRIYLSGLSMGGGSTWDYSAVYGQNLAAIVPVCGGTMPTIALARNIAAKNLPAWTISSTKDKIVHIWWATSWINWIKLYNPDNADNVKLTTYTSGESHNATWLRAFNPSSRLDGYNVYE